MPQPIRQKIDRPFGPIWFIFRAQFMPIPTSLTTYQGDRKTIGPLFRDFVPFLHEKPPSLEMVSVGEGGWEVE